MWRARGPTVAMLWLAVSLCVPETAMADIRENCLSPRQVQLLDALQAEVGAGRHQVTSVVDLNAPPSEIYRAATEVDQMASWMAGLQSGAYEARAPDEPISIGMVRRLSFGSVADVEEIVAANPPSVFAYRITGGMPVSNHLAVMLLELVGDGSTRFSWHQYFDGAAFSPIAMIQKRQLNGFVSTSLETLREKYGGKTLTSC